MFDPTIKGTENFLEAIHNSPKVKKVVIIASVAAWNTNFPLPAGNKSASDEFSETYPVSDVTLMLNNQSPKHAAKIIYQNQLAERQLGVPFQSVQSTLKEYNS